MNKKIMPLYRLTLGINLFEWELIPKKYGNISLWNRRYRSLEVSMHFLCFKLVLEFTYREINYRP